MCEEAGRKTCLFSCTESSLPELALEEVADRLGEMEPAVGLGDAVLLSGVGPEFEEFRLLLKFADKFGGIGEEDVVISHPVG